MNKIVITAFIIALFSACTDSKPKNNSGFEINGNLTNSKSEVIYLEKLSQKGPEVVDSATINEKGEFLREYDFKSAKSREGKVHYCTQL